VAEVIDLVMKDNKPVVDKVYAAVDCGVVVNLTQQPTWVKRLLWTVLECFIWGNDVSGWVPQKIILIPIA
jgi:hypothetical protein